MTSSNITPETIDALTELVNIGVGRASNSLNHLLNSHNVLKAPKLDVFSTDEMAEALKTYDEGLLSSVGMEFRGDFSGKTFLVFPKESALKLVGTFSGEVEGSPEMDTVKAGTLLEIGNIVINGVMGSMGNMLKSRILYKLPEYSESNIYQLLISQPTFQKEGWILIAKCHFVIEKIDIAGHIMLFFEIESFEPLFSLINRVIGKEANEL